MYVCRHGSRRSSVWPSLACGGPNAGWGRSVLLPAAGHSASSISSHASRCWLAFCRRSPAACLAFFSAFVGADACRSHGMPIHWRGVVRLQMEGSASRGCVSRSRGGSGCGRGDLGACCRATSRRARQAARDTGILLDPIYTLAAWEVAQEMCSTGDRVAMLHSGGALGLHGLAQRWPDDF